MDARDIERLAELLEFQRRLVEAQCKLAGMIAANQSCMGNVKHTEEDFIKIIDKCGIGYNDFPYYHG